MPPDRTSHLSGREGQEAGGGLPAGVARSRLVGALRCASDGTVIDANEAFLNLLGRTREEAGARSLRWQTLFAGADERPSAGEPWHAEAAAADGRQVPVLVEVVSSDETGWTAFVTDVSAARLAEHALVRTRELLEERNRELYGDDQDAAGLAERLTRSENALAEASRDMSAVAAELEAERQRVEALAARLANANRELDAFSYSVSHDLRTPLRTIDGFSRVLLSQYASQLDDRGRDYLQRIRNAIHRMSQLLDDLLKLARMSRLAFSPATVDLSTGAQQIAAELQQLAPARRVEWKIEPGMVVHGDRTLLRVALENLLNNAWKFTSRRDEAVIELGTIDVDGTRVFFVRDNGAGFDMMYANLLFGVFQRLHSVSEFEGTGVGLATVQRVIHRHGGEIWAEAAVGRGATFYFTLGQRRPDPAKESESPA